MKGEEKCCIQDRGYTYVQMARLAVRAWFFNGMELLLLRNVAGIYRKENPR
jgi:hypothetical protein